MVYILRTWKSPEVDMLHGTPVLAVEGERGPAAPTGTLNPDPKGMIRGEFFCRPAVCS
jgi:hypothetical protein